MGKTASFFARLTGIKSTRTKAEDLPSFKERMNALGNLPKLFRLIWETSRWMTISTLLLRLLQAAVPLVTLYLGKLIIDEIVRLYNAGGGDLTRLWELIVLEFAVMLISDFLSRGISLINSLLGDLFTQKTSIELMHKAAVMDLEYFEDAEFYDKMERARRQTNSRVILMAEVLAQVQDAITIGFLAVGLIAFNPWLILVLVVTLIPGFLGESHFNRYSYSLTLGWTPERRLLDYLRYAGVSDNHAKEVKIFGLSEHLTRQYEKLSMEFFHENRSLSTRRAVWGSILAAISTLGYYTAYVVIALQTVNGHITIGDLTFLTGSFSRMRGALNGILLRFTRIADGALYLKDLFDFLALRPKIVSPPQPRPVPRPFTQGIVFENVGFRYPGSEKWVLRHISFELPAGEKLALVGENGAGKTTLVKLLARLYDPSEGRILLDGRDLREYDVEALRQEVGIIFQDYIRYYFTAGENIAVGRIDQLGNQERIADAAARSLADTVIEKLPGQYQQMLGKRFENGVDLSGGEWQKIALARAYMRDAQLLILDEPTAALDARAEHEVFQRFTELTRGKSAVLISHRFSTTRMADRILVLEHGGVLEMGTHEELLGHAGRYAELFNLQAEGYR